MGRTDHDRDRFFGLDRLTIFRVNLKRQPRRPFFDGGFRDFNAANNSVFTTDKRGSGSSILRNDCICRTIDALVKIARANVFR